MRMFHRERKIVEAAGAAGNFTTLVTAIKAAGLDDALDGPGPFTMFAPTDEAFRKLPPGTVDGLLKDKAKLTAILKYHVVSGKVMAKDSFKSHRLRTMEGSELVLDTCDGFKVNNASVIQADMECRNGIIHSIDSVLMPGMGMGTTASMPSSGMAGMSSAGVTSPTMETSSSSATGKTESNVPGMSSVKGAGATVAGGVGAAGAAVGVSKMKGTMTGKTTLRSPIDGKEFTADTPEEAQKMVDEHDQKLKQMK